MSLNKSSTSQDLLASSLHHILQTLQVANSSSSTISSRTSFYLFPRWALLKVGENTTVPLTGRKGQLCEGLFWFIWILPCFKGRNWHTTARQSRQSKHSNNLLTADTFLRRWGQGGEFLPFAKSFLNYLFIEKRWNKFQSQLESQHGIWWVTLQLSFKTSQLIIAT